MTWGLAKCQAHTKIKVRSQPQAEILVRALARTRTPPCDLRTIRNGPIRFRVRFQHILVAPLCALPEQLKQASGPELLNHARLARLVQPTVIEARSAEQVAACFTRVNVHAAQLRSQAASAVSTPQNLNLSISKCTARSSLPVGAARCVPGT